MYIADLHIHSSYSRATSKDCDTAHLDLWARRKGIGLIGTGDFTHPAWRSELRDKLEPAEPGFYTLREEYCLPDETAGVPEKPRFVLSGEISSIYKKNGRVRKVHNVILLPSLEAAERISRKLEEIGNIHSDGRPILGLDSRDLLEITLDACPEAIFIPAHIWTPHFSLFGAFSGFDAIEECFEDLTPEIHALETGLSSDPPMNWRVSALDGYTLVSNSDAHSPAKLGREANLLDAEQSYPGLKRAIETGNGFRGTLEFFPEEGKYHLDGHRNCHLCLTPSESVALEGKCPVCGKKITIGVQHRVEELADRPEGFILPSAKPFESLAPLPEVIAASTGMSSAGKKVQEKYFNLLKRLGPEFSILREIPVEEIERAAGPCVAEGIRRLRLGQVERTPGYDGEFGHVSLLTPSEIEDLNGQVSLFGVEKGGGRKKKPAAGRTVPKVQKKREELRESAADILNPEQEQAVHAEEAVVAVVAGPGTGKTKTLVSRVAWLVEERGVKPSEITAVTFTNQAAAEMRERLELRLGGKRAVKSMTIGTFHAICLNLLGEVRLAGEQEALEMAAQVLREQDSRLHPQAFLRAVSLVKNGKSTEEAKLDEALLGAYCESMREAELLDFDDLLVKALEQQAAGKQFTYLLVDEFQDINEVQYRLVRQWSAAGKSLFVIGDPDQSIYGFRGSDARCFNRLREDFPALREIRLTRNYRSTPEVLSCALPVISRNPGEGRVLVPYRETGCPVRLLHSAGDFAEAVFIAKEIGRMTGGVGMLEAQDSAEREVSRAFSEIAVLCRTHRQLDLIEKCLRHDSIPCLISGREDFLQEESVRGTLLFFQSLLDAGDRYAFTASLRLLWNCPEELAAQAWSVCDGREESAPELLREAFGTREPLIEWIRNAEDYLPKVKKEKPAKLLDAWFAKRETTASTERLLALASYYPDFATLLRAVTLGEEDDLRRASGKSYSSGAVRLMTLHGSKGLEFPVVFLAGVKAGTLPYESSRRPSDPEEERRLFYVGMTRAREELVLLTSEEPSAFLLDLPKDTVRREEIPAYGAEPESVQMSLF